MLRWLEPKEIGMWQAIAIIQAYLPFAQLGIQSGLNRDLPVLLGSSETEKASKLIATAKAYAFLLSFLFIVFTIVAVIVLYIIREPVSLIAGIATIGIMAASFSYQNHLSVTFRSAKSFDKLAVVNFIYCFFSLGFLYFIYKYHYHGILIYYILSNISLACLTHYARPFKTIVPKLRLADFIHLFRTGLIMMSFNQIRSISLSLPKLIILKLKGISALGLYSPALAVNSMFSVLPFALAQFFHPQMGFKYGRNGNARQLWKPTQQLFWFIILSGIPIAVILWFSAPMLLNSFFPKYIDSLWPMRIMSVAFIFSSSYTTHGVLYSIKAYKFAYFYSATELIGYFLFPLIFISIGSNFLIDVTLGILFNNFFLSVLNYFLLKYVLHLPSYNQSD